MKLELTEKTAEMLDRRYPILKKIADSIYNVTGVTLDDMRSQSRLAIYIEARVCFWKLAKNNVQPLYIGSTYINREHSCSKNWDKYYENAMKYNTLFSDLFLDVEQEFKKI